MVGAGGGGGVVWAMAKETRGGLSDSIGQDGGEMESGASAYVLSTSSHTVMQMWEETHEGATASGGRIEVVHKGLKGLIRSGGLFLSPFVPLECLSTAIL